MSSSITFRLRDSVEVDKHRLVELFFKDWVDNICDNEVRFTVQRDVIKDWTPGMVSYTETFRVLFENQEDELALRLKGVPVEFQKYLEMIR